MLTEEILKDACTMERHLQSWERRRSIFHSLRK